MLRAEAVHLSDEVRDAIAQGQPVVSLESTIIAHGMPYPTNVEVALAVEQIVRDAGAIPATIGILQGRIKVGLTPDEVTYMGTQSGIIKATERDIPFALARHLDAATTAGCSLAITAAAGIHVFVTGGIGGVGPMAAQDFDISGDLLAIATYPCLTVCSGSKAFMDIPATLEYLETHVVPVMTYQTDQFPMFYSRESGCRVEWVADTPSDVAQVLQTILRTGTGGLLLGVPVPTEDALPEEDSRVAIAAALAQIQKAGITGKQVTPYLLSAIKEATGNRSLQANIALIRNNAHVGAQVAVALAKL